MNDLRPLVKGERIQFPDHMPLDAWIVTHVSPAGATVERELKAPKLVEIKNDEGEVVRSFFAKTSGDRMQISTHSQVVHLPALEEAL